jgi:hypothetical protein
LACVPDDHPHFLAAFIRPRDRFGAIRTRRFYTRLATRTLADETAGYQSCAFEHFGDEG